MNVVCSGCGNANAADREYCSFCQALLTRSPQVMHKAWEAAYLRRMLSSSGIGSILWGILAVVVGLASLEASELNVFLIGIGLFLIGTGIAAWASPGPTTLRLDGIGLLLVGLWNLLISFVGGLSSQFMWAALGVLQVWWAIQRFGRSGRFVQVRHIPKSLAQEVESLVNSVQRANTERVEFRVGNKLWQARLLPDLVVVVTGAGNAHKVRFVMPDEFDLQVTGEGKGRQWPPASIRLGYERWSGLVAPASLERYAAWQAVRNGPTAGAMSEEGAAELAVDASPEPQAPDVDQMFAKLPGPAVAESSVGTEMAEATAPAIPTEPQEPVNVVSSAVSSQKTAGKPRRRRRSWLGWAIAALVLILSGVLAYWGIGLSVYNRGVEAHNNLDVETALLRYGQVMRYYPTFFSFVRMAAQNYRPCALYQQAHKANVAQNCQDALEYYAQFIAEYPSDRLILLVSEEYPLVCMTCAQQADQQGDYLKAIVFYRQVLVYFADSPQVQDTRVALSATYCKYGAARSDAGDYGAAVEVYQKALAVAPQNEYPPAQQGLWATYQRWGNALLTAGEYEMALARYQDALDVGDDAQDAPVWSAIGQVYLAWVEEIRAGGEYEQAIELAVQALEAFPGSEWQDEMLALIGDTYVRQVNEQCQAGEYQAALDICTVALHTFPKQNLGVDLNALRQTVYLGWARALNGQQAYAQAIEVYRTLIKAYPETAAAVENEVILAHYNWARDAWDARDYRTTVSVYEALIKSYPTHSLVEKARQNLSQVHYDWAVDAEGRQDLSTAIAHYEQCLALEESRVSLKAPPAPLTYTITVNTDSLNVRRGPAADQAVVGVAKRGQTLTALGRCQDGQWIKVKEPDGWVFASLVTGKTPVSEMAVFSPAMQPVAMLKPAVVEQSALAAQAWEAAARVVYRLGMNLYDAKNYEKATLRFQAVIDKYPLSQVITETRNAAARAYLDWGDVLSSTARYEDAAKAYGQVKLVNPTGEHVAQAANSAAAAYLAWADSLYAAKSYSDAIEKYAYIYTNYPSSSHVNAAYRGALTCYTEWGNSLRQQGKYEQAIVKYQVVITGFTGAAADGARVEIGKTYNLWGAALHAQKKYADAMAKFALAWQATSNAEVVTAAQKGYNDALWGLARLTDEIGNAIINAGLTTACQGQVAASPAVGLAANEAGKARCNSGLIFLPADLQATMPAHFRYAVCMTSGTNELERCAYTGGRTLVRQQVWWKVTVRNAKTGGWLAENTFYGPLPANCPFSRYFRGMVDYVDGGSPSADSVINWLRGIIK